MLEFLRKLFGQPDVVGVQPGPSPTYSSLPRLRCTPAGRRGRWPESGDPAKVAALGLPSIPDIPALCALLELGQPRLRWLASVEASGDTHYTVRTIPKRSGGTRILHCPKPITRWVQRWILDNILARLPVSDAAHGFVKGRSIVTNAAPHAGRELVVSVDLQDFFPSVSSATVKGLFAWMGYSEEVAGTLARLCTAPGARRRILPQGSPSSPALTNLICWKLDRRLAGLAAKYDAAYTRYADDLTFSGARELKNGMKRFYPRLQNIIIDEGFRTNKRKFRFARKGGRQTVTGLVVNERPSVPRPKVRRLRAILHNCARDGVASQNRDGDPLFLERLRGEIAFVSMVNPAQGARLKAAFDRISA